MAKNKQSYFDQTIRQFGDDFVPRLTPDNIQKSAKRKIFRDIVQGNIDYTAHGKYFSDPKFFENLLIAAWDELQNNTIILQALTEFDLRHPGNNQVIILKGRYNSLVTVYNALYSALYSMKVDNYNVGYLANIAVTLHQYRNII